MTRFDRRMLFASGAAAALLAATGVSLAGAPRRGGNLRIAAPRTERGLAPVALAAIFETLTEQTPNGILRGRLATGWYASSDARIWDLTLREDVTFHDNRALRVADVAASLERMAEAIPGLLRVSDAGDQAVRIEVSSSDPQLPFRLADPARVIRPESDNEATGLIGTGLYAARHAASGGGLVAVRAQHHYLDQDAGWADRVDVVAMSDPAERRSAFDGGLVDAVLCPDPDGMETGNDALVVADIVGTPPGPDAVDLRMAERFWLI